MTPERWSQVRALFDEALEVPLDRRNTWLSKLSGVDAEILAEVKTLLSAFENASDTLERSPLGEQVAKAADSIGDPYEGRRIGPYELKHRIGRGGMGSVYAAVRVDGQYRKTVAMKLVSPGLDSEEVLRRFRHERQVLASLDHPNIARLLDGGTTPENVPYLVMEFVEGQAIDQYCDALSLNITERLRLFRMVCEAVQYAHQNLVIHRDIKPANILVTPEGIPKLLDFGIAKVLKADLTPFTVGLTRVGMRPMTPDYASPEQIRGEPITTASDVYSLGVLLYKLLTGHLPYRTADHSPAEIERIICETQPTAPSVKVTLAEEVPDPAHNRVSTVTPETVSSVREGQVLRLRRRLEGDLDVILLMALRKEPRRRYPSAERLSDDLRRHLEGLPVFAQKDTLSYRVRKFVRRNRAGVGAATAALVALVAGLGFSLYYWKLARARFQAGLALSSFVLNDLDNAMQRSVTEARQELVAKNLEHLGELERTARGDLALSSYLVNGYLKMGDVQGNLFAAHVGNANEALDSYRKALAVAERAVEASPNNLDAQLDAAQAHYKIGNLQRFHGQESAALKEYQQAEHILTPLMERQANPRLLRLLTQFATQSASLRAYQGDSQGALEEGARALRYAHAWKGKEPGSEEAVLSVAVATELLGQYQAGANRPREGLATIQQAVAQYRLLLAARPRSDSLQRDLLAGLQNLGDVQIQVKDWRGAVESFGGSLEIAERLLSSDPANQQAQRDVATACSRLARPLMELRDAAQARARTVRALELLKGLAANPKPVFVDVYQYATLAGATPFADLRDTEGALKALAGSSERGPWYEDAMAQVYFGGGQRKKAIECAQRALTLLPPGPSAMRAELQANLDRYSAAAAQ